ncbi:DUF881 domain-containing protein [Schaalia odontolytica]|uniref:Bacterial protein of uncharacterized function (DUF881) n=1 Tax=Schaalia odontolytica TaxID=1660 RepID=A0A2X0VG99_9ACTO|nr:DUF881 domain-containing protein [Schaalia odontolytica]WMS27386.1 DUF881 domain-containing protein [Schaalia odontolytica]SPT56517.1 Bacterial protein of uncharacterised function (DUF881) [Schaalia odontolytica]
MTPGAQRSEAAGERAEATLASSADPAASMSLLNSLLANPLDAGYEHFHADRGSRPASVIGTIGVFAVAVALGFASIVATSSLRAPASDVKSDLKAQASERTDTVEALNNDVQSLGRAIEQYSGTGPTAASNPAQDLVTATTPVVGPGITVTLTDRGGPGKGSGAVRDQDLAIVVNALWAAGADAVSINGQRVGPDTFVRTAGSVILVNVTPVSSPYEVSAIGDANALSVALVRGATGDYLSAAQSVTGMTVSSKVSDHLQMEALTLTDSRYATPVGESNEGGSS